MSGMSAQISASIRALNRELETIAHNQANVSTVGFKKRNNHFATQLKEQLDKFSPPTLEVQSRQVFDYTQGNLIHTGRNFDFGLHGRGFFTIETPDGVFYTRNGTFNLDENRQIVDSTGNIVAGKHGPIVIPKGAGIGDIAVSEDGTITANGANVDRFNIVDFGADEEMLTPVGYGKFSAPKTLDPKVAEETRVRQGHHEGSNVNMIEELVDMIMVQRLYEANMRILGTTKDSSSSLMNVAMG